MKRIYLKADELEQTVLERFERYAQIEANEVKVEEYMMDDAEYAIVAFGATSRIAKAAIQQLREQGIKVGLIRPITLWPFPVAPFEKSLKTVKHFISVELSMGQMIEDVRLATQCRVPVTLCNRVGGMIPSTDEVLAAIRKEAK